MALTKGLTAAIEERLAILFHENFVCNCPWRNYSLQSSNIELHMLSVETKALLVFFDHVIFFKLLFLKWILKCIEN